MNLIDLSHDHLLLLCYLDVITFSDDHQDDDYDDDDDEDDEDDDDYDDYDDYDDDDDAFILVRQ